MLQLAQMQKIFWTSLANVMDNLSTNKVSIFFQAKLRRKELNSKYSPTVRFILPYPLFTFFFKRHGSAFLLKSRRFKPQSKFFSKSTFSTLRKKQCCHSSKQPLYDYCRFKPTPLFAKQNVKPRGRRSMKTRTLLDALLSFNSNYHKFRKFLR